MGLIASDYIFARFLFMELIDFILHVDAHLLEFVRNYGGLLFLMLHGAGKVSIDQLLEKK